MIDNKILTWPKVEELRPCEEAIAWGRQQFGSRASVAPSTVIRRLMRDNHLEWANWLIVRCMNYKQYVAYGIYAAKQVLNIYERIYPNDQRPRQAINAANQCLQQKTSAAESAAESAARSAAESAASAAESAAWSAAESAASAASAARSAAESAASAAESAAESAAWSAAESAASAAESAMQKKILHHGVQLLRKASHAEQPK